MGKLLYIVYVIRLPKKGGAMAAGCKFGFACRGIHLRVNPVFLFAILTAFISFTPVMPQGNHVTDSLYSLLRQSRRKASLLNEIAAEYNHISYSEALEISKQAMEAARREGNVQEAALALYNMACNYMSRGDYDSSEVMLDRSLQLAQRLNSEPAILRVGNASASISFLKGRLDESLLEFESNLERARAARCSEIIISAVVNIGRIHWLQGRNEQALICYDEALVIADSLRNNYMSGMILLLRGIVYQAMGFYELSAVSISRSVSLFEQMNYLSNLPYAYSYLGSVYMDLAEYDNAMFFLRKALLLYEQNNDYWGGAIAARFLGSLYNERDRSDSADYLLRTSLALANRLNDINGALFSRRYLAELMLKTGKPDSALILLQGNLDDARKTDNLQEMVNNLYDLGRLNVQQGHFSPALDYFNMAVSMADSLGYFYEGMLISQHLSDLYEKLGDYGNALIFNKRYKSLSDTIFSKEKRRSVDELRFKYETEKKNREISTLTMEKKVQAESLRTQRILGYALAAVLVLVLVTVVVLWRSYIQKKKSDKEKALLLKEIHHRVKNNLQTVSSLLSLQSGSIGDKKIKEAVRESQSRVKSMALIHQVLYQQEEFLKIDIGRYLRLLADNIAASYGEGSRAVRCMVTCDSPELDIDTAIPLGLISNELIVNAYKYAFNGRDKGEILVSLYALNNRMLFSVSDNGNGLPPEFSFDQVQSLGLRLVNLLTRQMRGEITLSSDKGTRIEITFPIVQKKT